MFERFTQGARKTVVLANEEAKRFNHPYVGTEHLLLGLIRASSASEAEPSIVATVLKEVGITLEEAREKVEEMVGNFAREPEGEHNDMPFTPRAKKVFELALREALRLYHNYIGCEHLLLGLLREGGGVADCVLVNELGVRREALRSAVIRASETRGE